MIMPKIIVCFIFAHFLLLDVFRFSFVAYNYRQTRIYQHPIAVISIYLKHYLFSYQLVI